MSGDVAGPRYGYCAAWNDADGYEAVIICGHYADVRRGRYAASWLTNHDPPRLLVRKPLAIAGRPAWVAYSPRGARHDASSSVVVEVYDPITEAVYEVRGTDPNLRGANTAPVIAIARSLFEPPNPLPPPTAFRYDTYDTTGEVAEPGSYAFLLADEGSTTAAATWEDVVNHRGTTQLRVHSTDAEDTSQAPFYDEIAVGNQFRLVDEQAVLLPLPRHRTSA